MTTTSRRSAGVLASAMTLALLLPEPARAAEPTIDTVAGGLPRQLAASSISLRPGGLAFGPDGTLYATDAGNGLIWAVREGKASVIAGNGLPCSLDFSFYEADPACRGNLVDGVAATSVSLSSPTSIVLGPDGALYFSETRSHVVRRLDLATETLSIYAGTGDRAFGGDGGTARAASLHQPSGLAFDSVGNLYIADTGNHRIRRVSPTGTITTVVGCGERKIPQCAYTPQDGSPFEGTEVPYPAAVAVDPQDRLVMQVYGGIFRLDQANEVFRSIAGTPYRYPDYPGQGEDGPAGQALIDYPFAMTFAPNGDLYFIDIWMNRVQRIEAPVTPSSTLRHVAGCFCGQDGVDNRYNGFKGDGGPAVNAAFAFARSEFGNASLAFDAAGNLFIGDPGNHRVRRIDQATRKIETVVGSGDATTFGRLYVPTEVQPAIVQGGHAGDGGPATNAMLFGPSDVATDAQGNLYILDRYAHRVRRVSPDGTITTVAGKACPAYTCDLDGGTIGDGGPATAAVLYGATHLALSADGKQLYLTDTHHERLRQVNLGSSPVTVFPLSASPVTIAPGQIRTIWGRGTTCALLQGCTTRPTAADWVWNTLQGVAVDAAGNVYASDSDNHVVLKADAQTGSVTPVAGTLGQPNCLAAPPQDGPGPLTGLCGPTDLALGPAGTLYIAESGTGIGGAVARSRIRRVDLSAPLLSTTVVAGNGQNGYAGDGGPATSAMLAQPHGLAVEPDGTLWIADSGNSRIRKVGPGGTITTVAGIGAFGGFQPWPSPGLFDGCGFAGDGGPAVEATLCGPAGIAVGSDGTVYVADGVNNRVRAISGA